MLRCPAPARLWVARAFIYGPGIPLSVKNESARSFLCRLLTLVKIHQNLIHPRKPMREKRDPLRLPPSRLWFPLLQFPGSVGEVLQPLSPS